MSQNECSFRMDAKDFDKALKAIQALHGAESIADSGGRHFSWVGDKFHEINDFEEMMQEWRWRLELDTVGACGIQFEGEKIGDDQALFDAIAPWVKKGSYIEMHGEDGAIWRWTFDGEKCIEKSAKITFE